MDGVKRELEVVILDRDPGRREKLESAFSRAEPSWVVRPLHPDHAGMADHNIDPASIVLISAATTSDEETLGMIDLLHTIQPAARIIVTDIAEEAERAFRYIEAGAWGVAYRRESTSDLARKVDAAARPG